MTGEVAHTLQAGAHAPDPGGTPHVLAVALRGREGGGTAELGDDLANCLRASTGGGDKPHVLAPTSYAIQAGALRENPDSGPDRVGVQAHIAYTLEARAEVQAVCFAENSRGELRLEGGDGSRTGCLSTGGGKPGQGTPMVVCVTGDITHTLKAEGFDASEDGTGRGQPIVATAYSTKLHNTKSNGAGKIYEEYTVSLDASSPPPALLTAMAVRRLTPRECERLMGFPDLYTLVPVRGKPAADGPRYKALGNSWAVPVVRWIGARVDQHLRDIE